MAEPPADAQPQAVSLAERLLDQARAFLAAGNWNAATRSAEQALAEAPRGRFGYDALDVLADVADARDDHARAKTIADGLLAHDPTRIEGYLHAAGSRIGLRAYNEAKPFIDRGLERFPWSASLLHLDARRLLLEKNAEAAIARAQAALDQAPGNVTIQATLALCHVERGQREAAQRVIGDALAAVPSHAYALHVAAVVASDACNYSKAHDYAAQAVAASPGNEDARLLTLKSKAFAHPLLKPYWLLYRIGGKIGARFPLLTVVLAYLLLVVFAAVDLEALWLSVLAYYVAGLITMRIIEFGVRRSRRHGPLRLKQY